MDYYDIIGVNRNASQDEIKSSYRKKSLLCHPDRPSGSQEKFLKLNQAYEVLSDSHKRKTYDIKNMNVNPNSLDLNDIIHLFDNSGPEMNFFKKFNETMKLPIPIIKNLEITLEQAYTGAVIPLEIKRFIYNDNTKQEEKETLYITIPKGIDNNEIIKIVKKGNVDEAGNEGNIKLYIKLINHTEFTRKGIDLYQKKNISLKESLCGFSYEILHLNGTRYSLKNKKGNIVYPNYKKSINDLGMERDGMKGKLYIDFNIIYPKHIPDDKITLLEEALDIDY